MATVNIKGVQLRKRVVMKELDSLNEVLLVLEGYVKEIYGELGNKGVQKVIEGLKNKVTLANEENAYLDKHLAKEEEKNKELPKNTIIFTDDVVSPEDVDIAVS